MSAREATLQVAKNVAGSAERGLSMIEEYARVGAVRARALSREESVNDRYGKRSKDFANEPVPDWFWKEFTKPDSSFQDWSTGVFSGRGSVESTRMTVKLVGVEFAQEDIDRIAPPRVASSPTSANGGKLTVPKSLPPAMSTRLWDWVLISAES
jgi:hypothetical protein